MLPIAKKRERYPKRKFIESDVKITDSVVAEDANRKSAEYRETIRRHFDELEFQFPSLTCAAYARANRPRLTERTFHRWCSATWREEDRKKIKLKTEPKPESASRRGYKAWYQQSGAHAIHKRGEIWIHFGMGERGKRKSIYHNNVFIASVLIFVCRSQNHILSF